MGTFFKGSKNSVRFWYVDMWYLFAGLTMPPPGGAKAKVAVDKARVRGEATKSSIWGSLASN